MNIHKLARHINAVLLNNKENYLGSEQLRLQKVMFFVIADAALNKKYREKLKPYFEKECFELWDYGPVLRDVYIYHRYYQKNEYQEYQKEFSFLDNYIKKYDVFEPFELVEWTRELPMWIDNKESILERKTNKKYSWKEYLMESQSLLEVKGNSLIAT